MRVFYQFCFLFLTTGLLAQENEITGKITNDRLEAPVHIINLTREKGSISDFKGNFSIQANEGDSIQFSSVQYKKKILRISSEMITDEILKIKLEKEITELDEVDLHKLSGNLAEDLENIETYNLKDLVVKLPKPKLTQLEREEFTASTGPGGTRLTLLGVLGGNIPLDPILNTINGRLKRIENKKLKNQQNIQINTVLKNIPENYFLIKRFYTSIDGLLQLPAYRTSGYRNISC